jgi:NADPH:quinone reductase-like Zn-dependent oxidoreductase
MKQLVFNRFGEPSEVLQLQELTAASADPGPGQVRVRMLLSPMNPSDLLVVRGQYGRLPALPATPGFEGVGVVEAAGPGLLAKLRGLKPGRRVAVLNGAGGNWRQEVVISARQVVPLAADLPDEQGAMFFVNPATAVIMTRQVLRIKPGLWLLQTAAGSAVGRMVIKLGNHFGFKTINVVRRPDHAAELSRLGASAVLISGKDSIADKVKELTGGGAHFALDAVGGPVGKAAVEALGTNGRMLVYGTLSGEPIALDSRTLMVGQKQIAGFWLSEWVKQQPVLAMLRLFREMQNLFRLKVLTSEVAEVFALDDYQRALAQTQSSARNGKVLLRLNDA